MTFLSIIMAVIVIGGLILYMRADTLERKTYRPLGEVDKGGEAIDPDLVKQRWAEITAMQSHGGPGLKNALMEADKLLDYCMKGAGFKGENMGDRLKTGGSRFTNLNAVWAAHKLRNQMAHDVHVDVVKPQVEAAVRDLGQAIKDLGVDLA